MKITIVGAGNMGLCLLGYLSRHDNEVTLFTSAHKLDNKPLFLKNHETGNCEAVPHFTVTSSVDLAFQDTEFVFCTYPAFLRKDFIHLIENVINPHAIICFVPGYGGAEYQCKKVLERGVKICGLQRVPYVARYEASDNKVVASILSMKKELFVSSIPHNANNDIAQIVESLLAIPTTPLQEYLAVTLSPSNPLLHISGLYNVFCNTDKSSLFSHELNFYEEWNDSTSELLMEYDDELHQICNALKPYFQLDEVVPLSIYYESPTPQTMTAKLKSIESFKVVKVPLKKVEGNKYIVDLESRMFVEDFPFGVCMFKALALLARIETPVIDKLLSFYQKLSGKVYFNIDGSFGANIHETGIPQLYGLSSISDLADFYAWRQ